LTGEGEQAFAEALAAETRQRSSAALRPRDAATLILLERSAGTTKVLFGRRHANHKFMPGKFVFPGGRVEASDRRMRIATPLTSIVEEKLNARARRPSPHLGRALALAAIRETYEETGLALGLAGGATALAAPAGAWSRFAAANVAPALDGVDFLARAITPPGRPRRFDTRFLVADATHIARREEGIISPEAELVELVWMALAEASALDLPSITRVVLDELAAAMKTGMDPGRPRPFFYLRHGVWRRDEL
jgi:8-oxo-dGTP pyrophosphatase MutT (NUDIX family)